VLIGFALAWLINQKFRGNDLWTTIIVLPMMLSPAVVGNFWTFLYQPQIGLFNYVVGFFTGADPASFSMIGDVRLAPWSIVIVDTWMWTPFVMLICLAGLRSIPESIYEAAECDRAVEMAAVLDDHGADGAAVPDARGAVPGHRELQDVRPRRAAHRRRPRDRRPSSPRSTSSARRSRSGARAIASAYAVILFVTVFGLASIYVKALNRVKNR
jgi:multiple sugar transport system permease protein